MRRYANRNEGFHQNKIFQEDAKKFYCQLSKQCEAISDPPSLEKIEGFWRGILEDEVIHNTDANWIRQEEQLFKDVSTEEWEDFTNPEIQNIVKNHIIGNHQALTIYKLSGLNIFFFMAN